MPTLRRCSFAAAVSSALALAGALHAAEPVPPVRGTLTVGGKPLTLRYAWLVRGPDTFDASKMRTYVVMTPDDVSPAMTKCANLDCALFDAVRSGLTLGIEPEGYWLRAVHPELKGEKQFSGPAKSKYGWKPALEEKDRAAGHLTCGFEPILCELDVDARLLKEYPAKKK